VIRRRLREERSKEISLNHAIKLLRNEETVELSDVQNVTVGHSEGLATRLDGCILEDVTPDIMGLENSHNEQPHDLHCLLG